MISRGIDGSGVFFLAALKWPVDIAEQRRLASHSHRLPTHTLTIPVRFYVDNFVWKQHIHCVPQNLITSDHCCKQIRDNFQHEKKTHVLRNSKTDVVTLFHFCSILLSIAETHLAEIVSNFLRQSSLINQILWPMRRISLIVWDNSRPWARAKSKFLHNLLNPSRFSNRG